MKILKYLFITIGSIFFLFILFGFIHFVSQPNPPEVIHKISNNEWKIETEFSKVDQEFWTKENDLLVFNNQSERKESVTLFSNSIPSEHKKNGYITSSVIVPGGFDTIADNAIFGFQLGEKGANPKDQFIMGLNGKGEVVALNGELEGLDGEEFKKYTDGNLTEGNEVKLGFHYYRNPKGWVIFFQARGGTNGIGTHINYIPVEKLDDQNKELSLFIYNPSQEGELWFKEWNIQNDWTPND